VTAIIATATVPAHARLSEADTVPMPAVDPAALTDLVWGNELHPWWDSEEHATGCGSHMSAFETVQATADESDIVYDDTPVVSIAAFMDGQGRQGVHLHLMRPGQHGGESWATFTAHEWLAVVAAGAKAMTLIDSDPRMATLPPRPKSPLGGDAS
jgi:hypothetical protein